ncbi:Nicotinate-nucleotide--dimethylbenzimidazole phosphoribosyltransferase (plasmid) [Deinococcus proteolyticus MRP]|uniref:Nicotinate-nucleotide--dimethylbenzimidazole phosphoribosyltransferase n=1 Tax=Deinococcus proteolyticus (strain ATCC 35074 / DSM 20540 / JCM 6276 / NBRC 101906 / NCIMB 13154 / VKM Ac-1939 / CCM 2703 / MRP) TaxID=693977 RepID=F0RR05_DEIPM|nr:MULTISPECIES: nicotinate-nucleotide--dimethylbenzimidazole phosphoribosyltransferase [Deinococcus]ADY27714.1 Nicotinate-nucleotide--dimethylbenzimidazole phosphoribosyltransferase [Deinococcus proteolyticus MRP]MCY1703477.1 nicotinate-nucleotide--dimethylbenzimidazole phosphoribosyltransferase [Deinococcus sp. SL84]
MNPLYPLLSRIVPADRAAMARAQARQAQLTKPAGALGDLETLSVRLAGVFGSEQPAPQGAAVLVAAGDHGVAQDSVSAYPPEVTPAMVMNFLTETRAGPGGAAVNVLARTLGARVYVMDAGVDAELPTHPALHRAALYQGEQRRGTRNLRFEAAMSPEETYALILAGAALARRAIEDGADFIVPGEMGIGNTTPAAAITARLLGLDAAEVTGRGTGVDDERLAHKVGVVREALGRSPVTDPIAVLAEFGGFEIAAMLGMMLETAAQRRVIVLDGFVEGSAALVGTALCPQMGDYLFPAGHCAERGHAVQLAHLGLKPMFDLGLRLGEGSGGVLALPLLRAAAATLREMQTFEEAGVPG